MAVVAFTLIVLLVLLCLVGGVALDHWFKRKRAAVQAEISKLADKAASEVKKV